MLTVLHNKIEKTKKIVEYPSIYKQKIEKLDSNLEFYEIVYNTKPVIVNNQYYLEEVLTLSDDDGEFLKICYIDYIVKERNKNEILLNYNNKFGDFIDEKYPIWQRLKDITYITEEGNIRKEKERILREKRENDEKNLIDLSIFPDFNFIW